MCGNESHSPNFGTLQKIIKSQNEMNKICLPFKILQFHIPDLANLHFRRTFPAILLIAGYAAYLVDKKANTEIYSQMTSARIVNHFGMYHNMQTNSAKPINPSDHIGTSNHSMYTCLFHER